MEKARCEKESLVFDLENPLVAMPMGKADWDVVTYVMSLWFDQEEEYDYGRVLCSCCLVTAIEMFLPLYFSLSTVYLQQCLDSSRYNFNVPLSCFYLLLLLDVPTP